MTTYFYAKYIVLESLIEELDLLDLSVEERYHLASLIDSSLTSAILDEILSNLDERDKRLFVDELKKDPQNEKLMEFLHERIGGIEDKIKKVADDLVKELYQDIKEAKRVKKKG